MAQKQTLHNESTSQATNQSWTSRFLACVKGWKLYVTYSVRNAGFAFACLYMTVLGFDNITYGFCLHQCVSESTLGAMVGVSSVIGICATIAFPFFRKWMGLAKTGIVGMVSLELTLFLGLISIFLDGSPFDPGYLQKPSQVRLKSPIYIFQSLLSTCFSFRMEQTQKNSVLIIARHQVTHQLDYSSQA